MPVDEALIGSSRGAPAERVTLPVFLTEDGLVTDAQVRRLREKRMAGKTLAAAAAAAGMSERAARKWQSGPLPSTAKASRWWRTREDPFGDVWQSEVVPQLVADTDGRLQGALWTLGAVPAVLRHDNLSAATHELRRSGGRQLTVRFRQVLDHYGLRSSRIQPGKPHENGVAEQAHFRTATAIEQALLLRGERDFVDEERNAPAAARLAEERPYLRRLPSARVPDSSGQ